MKHSNTTSPGTIFYRSFALPNLTIVDDQQKEDKDIVEGYAATYNTPAVFMHYIEVIKPHAFDNVIKSSDCRALFNHESSQLLARQKNKTLQLWTDNHGLKFRFVLPKSRPDIKEMIQRGDLNEMSFAFTTRSVQWTWGENGKPDEKQIVEIDKLYDISLVTYPAYQNTTASLRYADWIQARKQIDHSNSNNINHQLNIYRSRHLDLLEKQKFNH